MSVGLLVMVGALLMAGCHGDREASPVRAEHLRYHLAGPPVIDGLRDDLWSFSVRVSRRLPLERRRFRNRLGIRITDNAGRLVTESDVLERHRATRDTPGTCYGTFAYVEAEPRPRAMRAGTTLHVVLVLAKVGRVSNVVRTRLRSRSSWQAHLAQQGCADV